MPGFAASRAWAALRFGAACIAAAEAAAAAAAASTARWARVRACSVSFRRSSARAAACMHRVPGRVRDWAGR